MFCPIFGRDTSFLTFSPQGQNKTWNWSEGAWGKRRGMKGGKLYKVDLKIDQIFLVELKNVPQKYFLGWKWMKWFYFIPNLNSGILFLIRCQSVIKKCIYIYIYICKYLIFKKPPKNKCNLSYLFLDVCIQKAVKSLKNKYTSSLQTQQVGIHCAMAPKTSGTFQPPRNDISKDMEIMEEPQRGVSFFSHGSHFALSLSDFGAISDLMVLTWRNVNRKTKRSRTHDITFRSLSLQPPLYTCPSAGAVLSCCILPVQHCS